MDEKKREGQILVQAIIEILGAPKSHVEETMMKVVDNMEEQEYLELISDDIAEAKEQGELFSTFAEVEIWIKSFGHLIEFIFNYTPSTIQVLEPTEYVLKREDVEHLLNEVSGRIHTTDASVKDLRARNQIIDHNTRMIIKNFIIRTLEGDAKNAKEVATIVGVPQENVDAYLELMEKEGKIKKEKDKFTLA